MKLLIDTNVILDMIFQRDGYDDSMKLFRKIRGNGHNACITASAVTVLSVTEKDIRDVFGRRWKDFEDCVQYMTGNNNGVDCIITKSQKDYEDAALSVRMPAAWTEQEL